MALGNRIFGLGFEIDHPVAGIKPIPGVSPLDVHVSFAKLRNLDFVESNWTLLYCSPEVASNGSPIVAIDRDHHCHWLRMRYYDGTTFILNRAGTQINVSAPSSVTADGASTYLVAGVFGLLLYLRGLTCLHASAIAYRRKALVFVGDAEAGKSTLAAAFAKRSHRVLTDDILVLGNWKNTVRARPGIPRIGLWPKSVEYLWGHKDALPKQVANWDKRYFGLIETNLYQDTALAVGAVYVLGERREDARPHVSPLKGTDAALSLFANKYVTRISEREQEKRDFYLISRLAKSVPVRRLIRSDALTDLSVTCDAILEDYESSTRKSA